MARSRVSIGPLSILREAIPFALQQRVLIPVTLFLLSLPAALQTLVDDRWPRNVSSAASGASTVGFVLAQIAIGLAIVWGSTCVLVVTRRMLSSRAGRSRTSFAAVRKQSSSLVFPVFFASILQAIVAMEWALIPFAAFLLVPVLHPICLNDLNGVGSLAMLVSALRGSCLPILVCIPLLLFPIASLVRTSFFAVAVVGEDARGRDALRASRRVVRGNAIRVLWLFATLYALLLLPIHLLVLATEMFGVHMEPWLTSLRMLLSAATGPATVISLISMTMAYVRLKEATERVVQVTPDDIERPS
jgi:hypothetical protein